MPVFNKETILRVQCNYLKNKRARFYNCKLAICLYSNSRTKMNIEYLNYKGRFNG